MFNGLDRTNISIKLTCPTTERCSFLKSLYWPNTSIIFMKAIKEGPECWKNRIKEFKSASLEVTPSPHKGAVYVHWRLCKDKTDSYYFNDMAKRVGESTQS